MDKHTKKSMKPKVVRKGQRNGLTINQTDQEKEKV